jgi:hypothetical protein
MHLTTLVAYERFVYSLQEHFPAILCSTLTVVHKGKDVAELRGEVEFEGKLCLGVREYLRFDLQPPRILQYSYEVRRGGEKLYWYDSQPHPNDSTLAGTYPHHKHIPPNIKRNRILAPHLGFTQFNLLFLIEEIEQEVLDSPTVHKRQ